MASKDIKKEAALDIFGDEIKPGSVIMFVSAAACLDVAAVLEVKWRHDGRVSGYKVAYPYKHTDYETGAVSYKEHRKHIRAGREVACVPASKLPALASAQACHTPEFGQRLLYISNREKRETCGKQELST